MRIAPYLILLLSTWIGGCSLISSRSVQEVAAIMTADGDRVLNEPMRPIRGGTRLLIFALDGVGQQDFLEAVRSGAMRNTAEFFGAESAEKGTFDRAYSALDMLNVLPSSTAASWTTLFTGHPPGETGVPGNEWFDRATDDFRAPNPVTTDRRYQVLRNYNEDRMGGWIHVPTVFERADVRTHVSLLQVYRGADMINIPEVEPFGTLFNRALAEMIRADSAEYRFYEAIDRVSIKSLDESLDRYGLADLQVVYLPGADLFTHIAPTPRADQQRYLAKVIDRAIGDVFDIYEQAGVLENTYVLFVSDHGQTEVTPTDRRSLWREGDTEPPELLRRAGFRVRPRALKSKHDDHQAVIAMQGGMAFVYLADRSTCPDRGMRCDWHRPPRHDEDLLAMARIFEAANRDGVAIPELQGTLDLILARTGVAPGSDAPPFDVLHDGELVPIGDYLADHPRPDLPDLQRRLLDLATGPYGYLAGDIALMSSMRLEDPIEDRSYFGKPHYTWHGSANETDSRIVFVLAHEAFTGSALRDLARPVLDAHPGSQALTPLILELLSR